jgi:hypothetical protein
MGSGFLKNKELILIDKVEFMSVYLGPGRPTQNKQTFVSSIHVIILAF